MRDYYTSRTQNVCEVIQLEGIGLPSRSPLLCIGNVRVQREDVSQSSNQALPHCLPGTQMAKKPTDTSVTLFTQDKPKSLSKSKKKSFLLCMHNIFLQVPGLKDQD